ncbi:MAG: N-acetylgalactosamine 6-sulfate sulfatase [Planctomyces sp.]|nr:N-acetylgalactosamine 6-sulfate sulfatase [Planctomyces sp.]
MTTLCWTIVVMGLRTCPVFAVESVPADPSPRVAHRPNIVFILADDLGWRDTSAYGSRFHRTPQIDRLVEKGMKFTNAYSASPLCSPTRASLLTGLWPARLRFTTPAGHLPLEVLDPVVPERGPSHQSVVTPQTRTRLPNDYVTSAELLQKSGYETAFFGKWHLGREPYLPENQGFGRVVGGREHAGPPGGYFAPFRGIDTLPEAAPGEHIDDLLTREAVKFIESNRDKPFFLNLWYYSVHAPFQAKADLVAKAESRVDPELDPQHCPTMAAMIQTLDDNVGQVVATLERLKLAENTVIVFTSDNGGNMYDEVAGELPTSNRPLRSGKGSIYEGGHRVPLVVVWPPVIPAGRLSEEVVTSVDMLPTLVELSGGSLPEGHLCDGVSLLPLLKGEPSLGREAVFNHFPHYVPATGNTPATSVRSGDMKLIRYYGGAANGTDRLELYDLKNDPGERTNLARSRRDEIVRLSGLIKGFLKETDALVPHRNPAYARPPAGWVTVAAAEVEEGTLVLKRRADQEILFETLDVPHVNRRMTLRWPQQVTSPVVGHVEWTTLKEPAFAANRRVRFNVAQPGVWEDVEVTLPLDDLLTSIRIEFSRGSGDVELGWIRCELSDGNLVKEWQFGEVESE